MNLVIPLQAVAKAGVRRVGGKSFNLGIVTIGEGASQGAASGAQAQRGGCLGGTEAL